jgi:hypothetical protein
VRKPEARKPETSKPETSKRDNLNGRSAAIALQSGSILVSMSAAGFPPPGGLP